MEENNTMDTPQPQTANTNTGIDPFGAPTSNEGSSDDNLSVADAFSGTIDEVATEAPSQDGQPSETPQANDAKNDETRYQYWQSQAAKKENELKQFKSQVEQAVKEGQLQQQPQAAPPQQREVPREFPPPPAKPEKPRNFSREEAWSDPASESARYLDDMDDYNHSIGEYRDLKSQYEVAVVREQIEEQQRVKAAQAQQMRAQQAQQAQVKEVYQNLRGHYGFNSQDAENFIKNMSNPNSISMDNLVQLYRMQQGAPQVNTESQGPSEAFQQSQNAQQVPSPMGVMPAQSAHSNRSDADTIMDDLINTHKSKNPWS
jgi:hypothetical protein